MCTNRQSTCLNLSQNRNDCDQNYSESSICKTGPKPSSACVKTLWTEVDTNSQNKSHRKPGK